MTQGTGMDVSGFRDVDSSPDPNGLIRFLDGSKGQPVLAALQERLILGLRLAPRMRVLDAGCGPGTQALAVAHAVPDVTVVGVDASRLMIAEAARRAASRPAVSFQVADAGALPFPDGSFDAVMAQTLLAHVRDPGVVVPELRRVTRAGGRIAALDLDIASTVVDHPDAGTTRTIIERWADGFAGGRVARSLHRLFRQAGLVDATVEVHAAEFSAAFLRALLMPATARMAREGTVDAVALERWWAAFDERATDGAFMTASLWFLASGTVA
jgi:ubiquinone/menaquinone biosynthesis C-methylase UbiE